MIDRKECILEKLKKSKDAISASSLGKELSVSRQVIVNDIALLRAFGHKIIATPRGYIIEKEITEKYIIACRHNEHQIQEELNTIIECGCGVIDVIINHEIYGEFSANLHIYSKSDIENFINKSKTAKTKPLCSITNDYHFHTLTCPTKEHFNQVKQKLKGICYLTDEE